jgi:surfactin synthase thioesterase subunit
MNGQSDHALLETIVQLGGIPSEILGRRDVLDLLLPAMRADLTLVARYTEQIRPTPLPCPVIAFAGAEDQHAGPRWTAGWDSTTTARFYHDVFPGDHFFVHAQVAPVIARVAEIARRPVSPGG